MLLRLFLSLIFFLLPGNLLAQEIAVRSGEHGEFTRLVFDIPSGIRWELSNEPQERLAHLQFDKKNLRFNFRNAFEKISRDRVARLSSEPGSSKIQINLACNCVASGFVLRDRMLVVDIKEASEPERAENEVDEQVIASNLSPKDTDEQSDLSKLWLGDDARIGPRRNTGAVLLNVPLARSTIDNNQPVFDQQKPLEIRNRIFSDVAGAASQGLLDASRNLSAPPRLDRAETEIKPSERDEQVSGIEALIDRESLEKGHISIGGQHCTSDKKIDLGKWSEENSDVSMALATRRSAVFGEFDRVNLNALRTYVRTMLHFGFGAEARAILRLDETGKNPELIALSYLVDGRPDPTRYFANQVACEGNSALWATLDGSKLDRSADLNGAALLRSYELLPHHLREHLGPILAENLTNAGFTGVAKDLLRRLERMNGAENESIILGKAQIDIAEGKEREAEEALKELTISQSPQTPKAIAATVELARSGDKPVPDRIVDLTAAYSAEMRDTENGPELWQAHVTSLLTNKRFEEALEVLTDVKGVSEELVHEAHNEIFSDIFKKTEDVAFLKFFFEELPKTERKLKDEHMLVAAKRVLDLGLAKAALATLEDIKDPQFTREVKLLKAQALIELSRPDEAEILLIGLVGDDASRMRAIARSKMGDHDFAQTIFAELGESDAEINEAWLSGDWNNIAERQGNPLASAAQIFSETPIELAAGEISLEDAEELFGSSSNSRRAITELLQATQFE